jgi:uncharacterized protein YqfA (UPF0365 family)
MAYFVTLAAKDMLEAIQCSINKKRQVKTAFTCCGPKGT